MNVKSLVLPSLVLAAAITATAYASPFPPAPDGECPPSCECYAEISFIDNPDIGDYLDGIWGYNQSENGCCAEDGCEASPCEFGIDLWALAESGWDLGFVWGSPDQSTQDALGNGQFAITGSSADVSLAFDLDCDNSAWMEMYAFRTGSGGPEIVLLSVYFAECYNCEAATGH